MTFGDFQLYAHGYELRRAREWEQTRFLSLIILRSQGANITDARDIMSLITDPQPERKNKYPSREETEAFKKFVEDYEKCQTQVS